MPHQPSSPSPGREEKATRKQKDKVTDYYPPLPMYIANYEEEDAPSLVDNLVPRLTECRLEFRLFLFILERTLWKVIIISYLVYSVTMHELLHINYLI